MAKNGFKWLFFEMEKTHKYRNVRVSVHPSGFVRTITCIIMHGFQNNLAQLVLEERCHLKHFFRWVEGQGHRVK